MSQHLQKEIASIIQDMCANCMEERCCDKFVALEEAVPFVKLFMKFRDNQDLFIKEEK